MNRTTFIDNIRIFLTAVVIFHHTAMIYGAMGGWYFTEVQNVGRLSPTSLALSAFCGINQAYFMGLFFLLAGYFTPPAYDKKGPRRFMSDRLIRLGVPLLAYVVFLGPMTNAMVARVTMGYSFRQSVLTQWRSGAFFLGPMWFVQALLIFTSLYVVYRLFTAGKLRPVASADAPSPLNNHPSLLTGVLIVTVLASAFRAFWPNGTYTFGMQLCYFGAYVFLFPVGCLAWRGRWLEKLEIRRVWPWAVYSVVGSALFVNGLRVQNDAGLLMQKKAAQAARERRATLHGGWLFAVKSSLMQSLFLTLLAWGIMLALLSLFRAYANRPSRLTAYLSEKMYAVYIVHAPVLTAVALAFRFWAVPHALKFFVTGGVACLASVLVADALLRIPGARRVL